MTAQVRDTCISSASHVAHTTTTPLANSQFSHRIRTKLRRCHERLRRIIDASTTAPAKGICISTANNGVLIEKEEKVPDTFGRALDLQRGRVIAREEFQKQVEATVGRRFVGETRGRRKKK